ncbi:NAD(P)/FAD-dependent oxidoreductase [Acidianus sp. RZ1]|uniref:NAD(P)/FAD-dependent oxidoreductase n=1 Tax=Acidianus sp. RZ1 TaxID=1540082 RepID=UPI001C114F6D|nr:NAD(P)/FAD-dependent oxidoreductase [Acidianus sp. RZ1]
MKNGKEKSTLIIKTDVIRLNREKLEKWLDSNLKVIRPVDAIIKGKNEVLVGSQKYYGEVIDASGWKGKAKWVKAVELETEPLDSSIIEVYLDSENAGGFSWIVPLPDKTLVGSMSYRDPRLFLPKVSRKIIGIHGGVIPRVRPKECEVKCYGDRTGIIKTFTGGGIFGIAELLNAKDYQQTFQKLKKEVNRQYYISSFLEKTWNFWITISTLLNEKTIIAEKEFDFHSLLLLPH